MTGSDDLPVFAWLGRLDRGQKCPEVFIEALGNLRGEARGVIYGNGPDEDAMRALADRVGADVHFAGHSDADPADLLRGIRAVVLLSHFEGVPFSVQEAMWHSVPVIVSRLPGNEWLCGDAALYADTVDETVAAMRTLLDVNEAIERGAHGFIQVRRSILPTGHWEVLRAMYEAELNKPKTLWVRVSDVPLCALGWLIDLAIWAERRLGGRHDDQPVT